MTTIRIHLVDTIKYNGIFNIIPKSHLKVVIRNDSIEYSFENETICTIKKGSAMRLKPLLYRTSNSTINNKKQRVRHLEFNYQQLT